MIERIKSFIAKNQLFSHEDRLLLAVSGGVDSVTLARLLHDLGYDLSIAHMNYQLRGKESNQDAEFVRSIAEEMEVSYYEKVVDTESEASLTGDSIQMVARRLRYEWFEELLDASQFDWLVAAHHADDNVETALFNLAKGTGIRGLRGIRPKAGYVVRPLLSVTKVEITAFAKSRGWTWREDASNQEQKYGRNKIRQHVVPGLSSINPAFANHFQYTQERLLGVEELLDDELLRLQDQFLQKQPHREVLSISWIDSSKRAQVLLAELLAPYGYSFTQSRQLHQCILRKESGKLFYSAQYEINYDRNQLLISRISNLNSFHSQIRSEDTLVSTPNGHIELGYTNEGPSQFSENPSEAYLDANKLEFPLTIRLWKPGDRFVPLGMQGEKKVSDLLVDLKVPITTKRSVLVLESDGKICWVLGYRIDDRFKLTPDTAKVLHFRITNFN
ncbi:MAG: tRNA lysidine(34) synthetase TilS, partial [Cyclobacteriaceae bacterium]|nr:tRNA lysidine(34) synthetase TilS [Cyclobacteriaceae bacterium HetDA_MAG_MS6]